MLREPAAILVKGLVDRIPDDGVLSRFKMKNMEKGVGFHHILYYYYYQFNCKIYEYQKVLIKRLSIKRVLPTRPNGIEYYSPLGLDYLLAKVEVRNMY